MRAYASPSIDFKTKRVPRQTLVKFCSPEIPSVPSSWLAFSYRTLHEQFSATYGGGSGTIYHQLYSEQILIMGFLRKELIFIEKAGNVQVVPLGLRVFIASGDQLLSNRPHTYLPLISSIKKRKVTRDGPQHCLGRQFTQREAIPRLVHFVVASIEPFDPAVVGSMSDVAYPSPLQFIDSTSYVGHYLVNSEHSSLHGTLNDTNFIRGTDRKGPPL
ncbi:hypothetical protein EVAR_24777_1 [Eumeta japonica]|uniref:Uncharacterized protein n=1 Tax=Eumeta variegata TaxID=151549 RepID=A0A4C1W3X1_EUMVA|nr:hypothetical protein EVAR_24777_1 [Eumeta japonica]